MVKFPYFSTSKIRIPEGTLPEEYTNLPTFRPPKLVFLSVRCPESDQIYVLFDRQNSYSSGYAARKVRNAEGCFRSYSQDRAPYLKSACALFEAAISRALYLYLSFEFRSKIASLFDYCHFLQIRVFRSRTRGTIVSFYVPS